MVCCMQRRKVWTQLLSSGLLQSLGHQFYSLELFKTYLQGERGFCVPCALSMRYKLCRKKILLLLSDGQDIRILSGNFPDSTVDRAVGFHCQGPRFDPWSGN